MILVFKHPAGWTIWLGRGELGYGNLGLNLELVGISLIVSYSRNSVVQSYFLWEFISCRPKTLVLVATNYIKTPSTSSGKIKLFLDILYCLNRLLLFSLPRNFNNSNCGLPQSNLFPFCSLLSFSFKIENSI